MSREASRTLRIAVSLACVAVLGGGCAVRQDGLEVAGNVRAEVRVVTAPALSRPATPTPQLAATGARTPVPAGRVARMYVRVGDRVRAGQRLAAFDAEVLELRLAAAEARVREARARVATIEETVDDLRSKRDELVDARRELTDAQRKLAKAGVTLRTQRAEVVKARATLSANASALSRQRAGLLGRRAALARQLAAIPAVPPGSEAPTSPPAGVGPDTAAARARLLAAIAGIDSGLVALDAGASRVRAGLAQADAGLAKLDAASRQLAANAAEVRTGLAKVRTGIRTIDDAIERLRDAKELAVIAADASRLGVSAAEQLLASTVVTAPVAGLVVDASSSGETLDVGAPVVKLRPDAPALVDAYLVPAEAERYRTGAEAEVRLDSFPGRVFRGRVSQVGSEAGFPPTRYATKVVHMTRAVRVTVRLDAAREVPAGVPVDVVLRTARP